MSRAARLCGYACHAVAERNESGRFLESTLFFARKEWFVDERSIEDILDTIGDEHARRVLAAISKEPKSAKELAEECDLSLPTVYRRIEMLDEYDLINARTLVADDGNHYKVYESNFESTVISLEDDEYHVRIYREGNLPDRFSQLWDEIHPE
jgi:predicted transcriptional regulator